MWKQVRERTRPLYIVAQSGIPGEVHTYLQQGALLSASSWPSAERSTYIDRKFSADPDELGRVCLQLANAALVGFDGVDSTGAQGVDGLEVLGEHVRVLVIFVGYVLLDCVGKDDRVGAAEGQVKDVAVRDRSVKWAGSTRSSLRTTPWLREAQRGRGELVWMRVYRVAAHRRSRAARTGPATRLPWAAVTFAPCPPSGQRQSTRPTFGYQRTRGGAGQQRCDMSKFHAGDHAGTA